MATDLDLDAIDRLASAATEGPWRHYPDMPHDDVRVCQEGAVEGPPDGLGCVCCLALMGSGYDEETRQWPEAVIAQWHVDAEFIAASRTLLPALAAEVRRLRAFETAARAYYDAYQRECVVHFSDRDDWVDAATAAHKARQDAEDALFALVHPGYNPKDDVPPALDARRGEEE